MSPPCGAEENVLFAEVQKEVVCVPRPISELKTEDPCGVRIISQGVFEAGEDEKPGLRTRPVFTEVEAIRRVLYLAKVAGCRLHVCHVIPL